MPPLRSLLITFAFAALVVTTGCKPAEHRSRVSGSVKLDGEPLAQGAIKFVPMPGVTGVVTGTDIKDGQYELPANIGTSPGQHRVEITAVRKTGQMVQNPLGKIGDMIEMETSAVAPRFNSASELTVTISPGDNVHDFDVESK
jgi:hypothetical protein